MKKIGILTSGGDCAGLNAVLRAVTYRAIEGYGWEVYGIRQGTMGFLKKPLDYVKLTLSTVDGSMMRMGGTILGTTNKGDPFAFPMTDGSLKDRSQEIINAVHELELDALIGVGGDGSHMIMRRLAQQGHINYIAIPKTIDNDLGVTENSIGFTTAVDVATEALDRLQPTAASHDRVMILEVMGRDAGHIALSAGIAGAADVILIPEIPYNIDGIAQKIRSILERGRNSALVVVSEAVSTFDGEQLTIQDSTGRQRYGGIGHYLSDRISIATGAETRFMVLGHVQRGGQPDSSDRILASAFGVRAVDLIHERKFDRMVAWQNRQVVDIPIWDAIQFYRSITIDDTLIQTALGLGIYIGDIQSLRTTNKKELA